MIYRLAWRSIWRSKRRTFITMASIALGLALAIFFLSMGEGVYGQVSEEAVRMHAGQITLEHPDYQTAPAVDLRIGGVSALRASIEKLEGVERTKLLILGQGVANSGAGAVGVSIMGVEPSVEAITSPLARDIVQGEYLADGDERLVILGNHLAEQLRLELGSKIVLTTNNARGELVEELCRVKGIFRTGSDEADSYLVQIPLTFARLVFGLGPDEATQLGVLLEKQADQGTVLKEINPPGLGKDIAVLPWQSVLPELASYIRLNRISRAVFQGLFFVVILFTILNTLLMSVVEREREFAVLLALGTPVRQLRGQLFVESAYIGCMGSLAGLVIGSAGALAVQVRGLDLASVMPHGITVSGFAVSTTIHARLTSPVLFWTGIIVLGSTLLLSLVPMRRIGRVSAAQTLR